MAGFKPDIEKDYTNLGRNFISFLKQEKKKVVAVFDGIEDLFQDKDAVINNTTALRGLIQQLPDWLEQQLDKPLGIIVLIRQDYVNYAVSAMSGAIKQSQDANGFLTPNQYQQLKDQWVNQTGLPLEEFDKHFANKAYLKSVYAESPYSESQYGLPVPKTQ
jgi:hypothetical protein